MILSAHPQALAIATFPFAAAMLAIGDWSLGLAAMLAFTPSSQAGATLYNHTERRVYTSATRMHWRTL